MKKRNETSKAKQILKELASLRSLLMKQVEANRKLDELTNAVPEDTKKEYMQAKAKETAEIFFKISKLTATIRSATQDLTPVEYALIVDRYELCKSWTDIINEWDRGDSTHPRSRSSVFAIHARALRKMEKYL